MKHSLLNWLSLQTLKNNLDWLVIACVGFNILLPKIELIRVPGTTTAVRTEDFVLAVLYGLWLVWVLLRPQRLQLTIVHKLMLVFVGLGAVSTLAGLIIGWVDEWPLAILNIGRRIEYMLLFWVAFSWLRPERLMQYWRALLGLSAIVVLICLLQYVQVLPMISTWQGYSGQLLYYGQNFSFVIGTFAGHYELGGYLVLMAPLLLAFGFYQSTLRKWLVVLSLAVGYYFALQWSFSRAAYFAVLINTACLFLLLQRYWLIFLPIIESVRIVWLYLHGKYSQYEYKIEVIAPTPTPTPISSLATSSATPVPTKVVSTQQTLKLADGSAITLDPSGATRVDVWRNAWEHFLQNPLTGTGYSSIGTGADNQYLRMLGEIGLMGLAAFLGLLGVIVWQLFTAARHKIEGLPRLYLLAVISAIIGLLAQAVLIDIFDSSKVALMLWLIVGLAYVIRRSEASA